MLTRGSDFGAKVVRQRVPARRHQNFSARLPLHWATWHYAKNGDLLAFNGSAVGRRSRWLTRYAHVNVGELAYTIDNPWSETDVPIIVYC
jgi:hypothetical protein